MGFLEERDLTGIPNIPEFYKGKTIFITGGSGFMGKVLVEKLLYSCSELDRIYLLLRNKKGVEPEDRLVQLYSSHCFDRLRREKPTLFESKVFVVPGDVTEDGLGLSDDDRTLLVNRVNIIFHVAASVRFDDSLIFAANMNLKGTKRVLELAEEMGDLYVLLHVSTSYSNTNRDPVEEVIYPPHADWRDTLAMCETLDEHTIRVLTPKYLGELPNTYTFTKQLAEHVVYEYRGKLPIVVIRPSIVISSVEEPVPGWVENFNGPVGLLLASGIGIMRSLYTDSNLVADYMPVDISIKSMLVAAWLRGTKKLEPIDDIQIYNSCAGNLNNATMGEVVELGRNISARYPLNSALWHRGGNLTTSKALHYVKVIMLHLLPAILVDMVFRVLGKKPLLVKIQRRIYIANLALEYYITRQWTFDNKNLISLRSCIKEVDRKAFYFEMENLDKYQYFCNAMLGAKRYLLHEKDEDLPKAKRHYWRMLVLDKIVQCVLYGFIFWKFLNTVFIQNVISNFFNIFQ